MATIYWPPILARPRDVAAACRRPHNRNPAEPSSDSGPVFTAHLDLDLDWDRIAHWDDEGAEDGASQSRFCALCGLDRVGHVSGGAECRRRQGLPPNGPVPPWIAGQFAGLAAPRSGSGTVDGGRRLRGAPVTFLCPSCGRTVQWTLWCFGCHRCRACCDCDPPEDRPPMPIKIPRWWVRQRLRKIRRLNSRHCEESERLLHGQRRGPVTLLSRRSSGLSAT